VVFKEVGEATAAKNNLNGYPIFGKAMVDIDSNLEYRLFCTSKQSVNFWIEVIVCIIQAFETYAKKEFIFLIFYTISNA
jgi:hypothetical protein